ncbi:MAG: threonine synthase, partial [Clostridia bacterium]|nr:threonine synthase [Clostridia bacterium]
SEVEEAVREAYGHDKFDVPEIAPVKELDANTSILELFHGPTLAFKDMALQLLPHLTVQAARKMNEQREIAILVATSGDTGKAALEGFRNVPGTSCTVFYPLDGVSDVQRLQMVTTDGNNTRVIAVRGNFDDAQTGVKQLFTSESFKEKMNAEGRTLSSANSINFGRLVPQIVYYFSAYADLLSQGKIVLGENVNFVVPTGNFGDILAAYYARCMGLPVQKLICASNRNDVLTEFFGTGTYSTHRLFYKTMSPSMDILVSSNLERLLYEASDRDGHLVSVWMKQLKESGSYSVGEQRLDWLRSMFDAGSADDHETAGEIARVFESSGYLMDPHTAVASHVLREYRERTGDETQTVVVSTASPYKFAPDVAAALKGAEAVQGMDAFACAELICSLSGLQIPPQVSELKSRPVLHTTVCDRDADSMGQAVLGK